MARQLINIGTSPNRGDGDPLRSAFDKINDNFAELYARDFSAGADPDTGSSSAVGASLVPDADGQYDIGTSTNRFADVYVKDFIYLNGARLEVDTSGSLRVNGGLPTERQDVIGDIFGQDSTKTFDSDTNTFYGKFVGDLTGSVFADDSTLAYDAVNNEFFGNFTGPLLGNITGNVLGDITGDVTSSGTSSFTGTVDFSGASITGLVISSTTGDITGSVFADDSTLLVDGVNGKITGEVTGTISSINWMTASDSYLTISNGGSTGPGPIQIVASANLDLTTGNNSDINMSPHGSGRVKVGSGGLGIVEAATFIGHADQTMYLSSIAGPTESTHITLNSTSGVATTMYGAVDFVSGGSVDFTGSTVTGLNVTGDITGSIFADDSTLLVDGVNGTIPAANLTGALPAIDGSALTGLPAGYADSDVDTHLNTGSAGSNEVLSWTGSDYDWVAQSGGGAQTRSTVTGTTSSLADAAEADLDITGFKSYALLTITTDRAARVRLYVSAATRTADASRAEGVDPTSDAGLIAEVITTGADTVIISPGAYGFNLESSPTTTIPCRVTNKSGGASTVQVDLNILQLEA